MYLILNCTLQLCDHFQRATVTGVGQSDAMRHVEELQAKNHARAELLYVSAAVHLQAQKHATLHRHFQSTSEKSSDAQLQPFPAFQPKCKLRHLAGWYTTATMLFYISWLDRKSTRLNSSH